MPLKNMKKSNRVNVCFSLRTADAFPVVASLPPKNSERSDDRKCVCGSQATFVLAGLCSLGWEGGDLGSNLV